MSLAYAPQTKKSIEIKPNTNYYLRIGAAERRLWTTRNWNKVIDATL
jgi:hypothetical protein